MKIFFIISVVMILSLSPSRANSRRKSFLKFNWKCENNRCIKKIVEYGKSEEIQSFSACKLLCGESVVWPNPVTKMIKGPLISIGKIIIDPDFIRANDHEDSPIKSMIIGAIDIFMNRIKKEETNVNHNYFNIIEKILKINIVIKDKNIFNLSLSTQEEAYELNINKSDSEENLVNAVIKGDTFFGIRHGLETLSQLIVHDSYKGCLQVPKTVSIKDYPKFPYRGIMLDTSRNYFSVESIKRTIDIMSVNKLNSFHWHISDTHSFPLKLDKYKEFAEYGAYSSEKVYTEDDIKSIVNYAKVRGIRIIPELDAPAHVGEGWQWTTPGTNLCFNKEPWGAYCGEPPCGQLNPLNDNVYEKLSSLYKEYIRLFQTKIFHMGADEVSYSCWETSDDIQKWIKQHGNKTLNTENEITLEDTTQKRKLLLELLKEFQNKALNNLKEADKNVKLDVILWTSDLTENENLNHLKDKDYIIQVWHPIWKAKNLLDNNLRIILSNSDALYLDCGFGSWVSNGNNWCTPYKSWYTIYDNRITNEINLTEDKLKLILGQEVALWSETVGEGSLDPRLWPRAAALAEQTWTDPISNWRKAEDRMLYHRDRLVKLGCNADAIEPEWCNINRSGCSYSVNNN